MARTTFLLAVVCLAQLGASVRQNMDLAARTLTALHTTEPSPFEEILKEPGMKECGKAIEAVQSHPAHREVFSRDREPRCDLVGTVKCTWSFVGTDKTETEPGKLRAVPMSPSMELSAVVPALAGGVARGLPSRWLRKENKDSRDFLCLNRLCTELAAKDLDVRQRAAESLAQLSKGDSFAVVMASQLQLVMCGLKPAQPGPVKLAILGALRSIAEKGHAVSVALHSNTLLPCLEDQDILVQRKVSALYRVLAEEGAAGMIAPDVKSIMQCFEATQANGVPLAAPLDALSAIAIAGEGLAVASVVDPLLRSLKDGRPKIRKSACATLGAIASGGAKELLGSLGLCAEAQGRGRASLFEMLVCTALDDRDDGVRLEAADALRWLPEADPDTCDETRQRFPLLVKRLRAERYGRYGDSRRGRNTCIQTDGAHTRINRSLCTAATLSITNAVVSGLSGKK
ncbi:unnamed protein product, partial [Symbiodinium necroappetens]